METGVYSSEGQVKMGALEVETDAGEIEQV